MPPFEIVADFNMTGDQPQAVDRLVEGLNKGYKRQTLLGVTGCGIESRASGNTKLNSILGGRG